MGPGYEHVVGFVLPLTGEIISNHHGKNSFYCTCARFGISLPPNSVRDQTPRENASLVLVVKIFVLSNKIT